MRVHQFFGHSPYGNFGYFLIKDESLDTLVVDPFDLESTLKEAKNLSLKLTDIVYTHEHHDHTAGGRPLLKMYPKLNIWAHRSLMEKFPEVNNPLEGDEKIPWGTDIITFLYTPGHTLSHICLLLNNDALILGDTLFQGGVGNVRNGGDLKKLFVSLRRIDSLIKGETILYPGHDYRENNINFAKRHLPSFFQSCFFPNNKLTTYSEEKKYNPFLNLHSSLIRRDLNAYADSDFNVFLKLRSLRDNW